MHTICCADLFRPVIEQQAPKLGFCVPFNATENDLEDEALAANHTLLAVDETRAAGGDERQLARFLVGLVMRWELGFEKGRLTAEARRSASVPFLLTSNLSLGAMASKAGLDIDDAHHGRLISIPLPAGGHGAFETLHGEADVVAFCRRIQAVAARNFGHPSRDFLRQVVEQRRRDKATLLAWLEKRRAFYLRHAHSIQSPGRRLNRIHEKMATVYAAACLAIKFGIFPWQRQRVLDALLSCTRDHVALIAREQADAARQLTAPLELLRQYVRQHRDEFVDLRRAGIENTSEHDHRTCPGYLNQHKSRGLEYLFSDWRFAQLVGGPLAAKRLKAELAQAGLIATAAGTGTDRYSVRRCIGKKADGTPDRVQVVAVRAVAFD
jgi:putative DNA primase/helicase